MCYYYKDCVCTMVITANMIWNKKSSWYICILINCKRNCTANRRELCKLTWPQRKRSAWGQLFLKEEVIQGHVFILFATRFMRMNLLRYGNFVTTFLWCSPEHWKWLVLFKLCVFIHLVRGSKSIGTIVLFGASPASVYWVMEKWESQGENMTQSVIVFLQQFSPGSLKQYN